MRSQIIANLKARFRSYDLLLQQANDETLQSKLPVARHKSLAEHLWCVVGARESYAAGLRAGAWQGFSCSMTGFSHADFASALTDSANAVELAIESVDCWNDAHDELLATLAEHEVMHEGQIIRHLYGQDQDAAALRWA